MMLSTSFVGHVKVKNTFVVVDGVAGDDGPEDHAAWWDGAVSCPASFLVGKPPSNEMQNQEQSTDEETPPSVEGLADSFSELTSTSDDEDVDVLTNTSDKGSCQLTTPLSLTCFTVKNTFIEMSGSDDEEDSFGDAGVKSCPLFAASQSSPLASPCTSETFEFPSKLVHWGTTEITTFSVASADSTPVDAQVDAECKAAPLLLPPPGLTLASKGSVMHSSGTCRPCAWFWSPGGCKNGEECLHCHLCPEGEIAARKKAKKAMRQSLVPPGGSHEQQLPSDGHPATCLGTSHAIPLGLGPMSLPFVPMPLPFVWNYCPPAPVLCSPWYDLNAQPPTQNPSLWSGLSQCNDVVPEPMKVNLSQDSESFWLPLSKEEFKLDNTLLEYGAQSQGDDGLGKDCEETKVAHLPLHLPGSKTKKQKSASLCSWSFHDLAESQETNQLNYDKVDFKVKNTFIDDFGCDEDGHEFVVRSCPAPSFCQKSSNTDEEPEQEPSPALPSLGSAAHGTGACRPCAWFWRPTGCHNGTKCRHCHLCPDGELATRKKAKLTALRLNRAVPESECEALKRA
eukprot:gnl/TRDRNA2_/TRDRNA2_177724_c0_seq2.p1 gnl/TRDRNA2_/TRDRNA2_177724_c0~~gnl/TRDRNA2_/TRDRNA2_177724_c0_seq2.p1  ORF type:complete len:565 (-),score=76.86 gnl/TRDRNA2_/TRDRNA2_177724_c0_seq2:225-1919(-)